MKLKEAMQGKAKPITNRDKKLSKKHLKDSIKFNKKHASEHLKEAMRSRKLLKSEYTK